MKMMRNVVFLAVCLLAFTSAVFADNTVVNATCTMGILKFYTQQTGGSSFFEITTSGGQLDYTINTPTEFTTGTVYLDWDILPTIDQIHTVPQDQWSDHFIMTVNGNSAGDYSYPSNGPRFTASGFNPLNSQCSVENVLTIEIDNEITIPGRKSTCDWTYHFAIVTSTSVCGDPQFVGLRGQSFQIHGIDGAVYNLISTQNFAVNSQFAFLTGPRPCPIMPTTGKKSSSCWSHEGSYLANLAFVTASGERFAALSGEAATGFAEVKFNDRQLAVGDSVTFSQGHIAVNSTHEITVQIGVFYIEVENIDGFVNLRRVRVERENWSELSAGTGAHGLLGQTWQNKRYSGKVPEIQGSPDDYVVDDNTLFGTTFPFSRMISN